MYNFASVHCLLLLPSLALGGQEGTELTVASVTSASE
jgi:hypothetical protein